VSGNFRIFSTNPMKTILNYSSPIAQPVAPLPLAAALPAGWLGLLVCTPGASAQAGGLIVVTD